jgi:hypothetical protein
MPQYQPQASTEKQRAIFRQLAERQSGLIHNGGLRITRPGRYAQVHRTAYEPLARINLAGLITFDSQDAVDDLTGSIKTWERPYIQGIMLPDDVPKFVTNVNLWNDDKVAMICMKLPAYQSPGAAIAVTRAFDEASQTWGTTRALDAFTFNGWMDQIRHMLNIPKRLKFSVIQVFDTKWGRPARSKNGLFNAVLKALDPNIPHPYIEGEPMRQIKHAAKASVSESDE